MGTKKNVDNRKFVVFPVDGGRIKKGIYCRNVVMGKDCAFVLSDVTSTKADVVPKASVFNTHEEAESYLAGKGVKRWVVGEFAVGDNGRQKWERHDVPMMFEALVVYYHYAGRFYPESRIAVQKVENGKLFKVTRTHGLETFETKEGAEKRFKEMWRARFKEIHQGALSWQVHLAELLKLKPDGEKYTTPVPSTDLLLGALRRISTLKNNNKLRSERGNKAIKIALDALKATES
jgi:hypothetical protein